MITPMAMAALLLQSLPAAAEKIRLKNGRSIVVDSVREMNGRVEYTVGENTYAVPKISVERIDTGGIPTVSNSAGGDQPPVPQVSGEIATAPEESIVNRVIHEGKVDEEQLGVLERDSSKEMAATAYFLAAKYEIARGSLERAAHYIQHARILLPDNDALVAHQASVSAQMGK